MFDRPLDELVRDWVERTGKDPDEIRDVLDRVREQMVYECAESVGRSCRERQESMLRERRANLGAFRERNAETWGVPFGTFEALIVGATEVANEINFECRTSGLPLPAKVEALTRLHARACQIANEVLWLCQGGFADGAMARWRSLHEVAVVSVFIAEHDEDLARDYLDFQAVEAERSAARYEKCCEELEFDHLDDAIIDDIKNKAEEFRRRYGESFKGSYGWASKPLQKGNPSFADIEAACDLSFIRTFYKFASDNVHAGPKGIFHKLGLALSQNDTLLAGPSNEGMVDPLQCASLSLVYATEAVMSLNPSFDYEAFEMLFWWWHEDLQRELVEAQEKLKAKGER